MAASEDVTRLQQVLADIAAVFDAAGIDWALVGGLAVSVYVPPRFTRDVDVAVTTADDAEAERLVFRLQRAGYRVTMALEQEAAARLATVRVLPANEPIEGVVVDLMFASSGIEAEICRDATAIEVFPGLIAPVARTGHLVALKILSCDEVRRPQDMTDVRALLHTLDAVEMSRAEEAVGQITARGYHRGRDLSAALEGLQADDAT